MALLTGGVWTGLREINRQEAAAAFDASKELKPCALIKSGAEVPNGPYKTSTRNGILIYLYQRTGNATIESAIDRIYALLHDKKIGSGTFSILHEHTIHAYELEQSKANALDASMAMMRFGQYRLR
jgi:hypothetical protein